MIPQQPRSESALVRDIMTRDPAVCVPSDSAQHAAELMLEQDTGIIPVVEHEAGRRLAGVVTDRDLCLRIVAAAADARATRVQECMSGDVVACAPDDPVETVLHLMQERQVRRIPVTDQNQRVIGIVAMADVLRRSSAPADATQETLERISEPSRAEARRA